MNLSPEFSIILPYLRAEKTIRKAVESVLSQTCTDFELITIGDGSNDGTAAILAEYAIQDKRLRNISYKENRGPSFARNRGIELALGKWIALLDADDWYAPTRLDDLIVAARSSPIITDNIMGVDPHDASETGIMFTTLPLTLVVSDIVEPTVAGSLFNYGYLKPTFLRAFIQEHGLRYDENLRTAEDLVFLIEACLKAKSIDVCDRAGYFYTLQVSAKNPFRKGTTHTEPRAREVALTLQRLTEIHFNEFSVSERGKLEQHITQLYDTADVNEFRHHFLYGSIAVAAAILFKSQKARSYVVRTLLKKCARYLSMSQAA